MTFTTETLDFLNGLAAHNDRDWFMPRKALYERAVKAPAEAFVESVQPELEALADRPLKAKVFRIYRDVRFSRDKRPYNAYVRIGWSPSDGEGHLPGWYFSLEPGKLFLGVGVFDLDARPLDAYRAAVADDRSGGELTALLAKLAKAGAAPQGAALKRTPAPYPQDHPRSDLLRRKGLTVWWETSDPDEMTGGSVVERSLRTFRAVAPVNAWLEDALG